MRIVLIIIGLVGFQSLSSQSLHRSVIGSAGRTNTTSGSQTFHWTIGETAVLSLSDGSTRLTQGFHQNEIADCRVFLGNDTTLCTDVYVLNAGIAQSYQWSTGATVPTIEITQGGVYGITTTDDLGCTASDEIVVGFSSFSTVITTEDASCFGSILGQINVQTSRGTPPFSFSINGVDYQDSNVLLI